MEISFDGKRALVTGASKGFGREIVRQLVKCRAKVVAVARNKQMLESLKKELPSIEIIVVDLSDWDATRNALKNVGRIDLLVNNAGLGWVKPLTEVTEEDYESVFGINTKALINVTSIIAKGMLERGGPGSIVNLSSQAGLVGLMEHTVYCASKGAVDAFTRAAALELGSKNIRVNAVNPTVILTDMGSKFWSDPKVAKPLIDKIPLHRFGEVHEVVDAVLYLLSDRASMISGVSLPIDGGFTST